MSRASLLYTRSLYARLWAVASSFYDGATGNRCFKLETITVCWIGGRRAHRVHSAFLCSCLQSWKARLDYRVHSCVHDNKPPSSNSKTRRSSRVRYGYIANLLLPPHPRLFLYRWIVLRKRTSSVVVGVSRFLFSETSDRFVGSVFCQAFEKCALVSTKAAYDRLRFVLRLAFCE